MGKEGGNATQRVAFVTLFGGGKKGAEAKSSRWAKVHLRSSKVLLSLGKICSLKSRTLISYLDLRFPLWATGICVLFSLDPHVWISLLARAIRVLSNLHRTLNVHVLQCP